MALYLIGDAIDSSPIKLFLRRYSDITSDCYRRNYGSDSVRNPSMVIVLTEVCLNLNNSVIQILRVKDLMSKSLLKVL